MIVPISPILSHKNVYLFHHFLTENYQFTFELKLTPLASDNATWKAEIRRSIKYPYFNMIMKNVSMKRF